MRPAPSASDRGVSLSDHLHTHARAHGPLVQTPCRHQLCSHPPFSPPAVQPYLMRIRGPESATVQRGTEPFCVGA